MADQKQTMKKKQKKQWSKEKNLCTLKQPGFFHCSCLTPSGQNLQKEEALFD